MMFTTSKNYICIYIRIANISATILYILYILYNNIYIYIHVIIDTILSILDFSPYNIIFRSLMKKIIN